MRKIPHFIPLLSLALWWFFSHCNPSSPLPPPGPFETMPNLSVPVNDSVQYWVHSPKQGNSVRFLWSFDGGLNFSDTTLDTFLISQWGIEDSGDQSIVVVAEDPDGRRSPPDTIHVDVKTHRPKINLSCPDSTASINDTIIFFATAKDTNGCISGYVFRIDSLQPVYSSDSCFVVVWDRNQEGTHTIAAAARDDDSLWSQPDHLTFTVTSFAPSLSSIPDTSIPVYDSISLSARGIDKDGLINRFFWSVDDSLFEALKDSVFCTNFSVKDTGTRVISVVAQDDDSLYSDTIKFHIYVDPCEPTVSLPSDTVVYLHDSVTIPIKSSDTNGKVSSIFWSYDTTAWKETTNTASLRLVVKDTLPIVIKAKAKDNHGIISEVDSMRISVLRGYPQIHAVDTMTGFIYNKTACRVSAVDPNGTVLEYHWSVNSDFDTVTSDSVYYHLWEISDTGMNMIIVRGRDNDSLWSENDTIFVNVKTNIPTVTIIPESTNVFINDSLVLKATAGEASKEIDNFFWGINDNEPILAKDSMVISWGRQDSGIQKIKVWAINENDVISRPDSCQVRVKMGRPKISLPGDTIISTRDTLLLSDFVSDDNGYIENLTYVINNGTPQTLQLDTLKYGYDSLDTVSIIIRAVDDDGLAVVDTLWVNYYHPERNLIMYTPKDTVWARRDISGNLNSTVSFRFGPDFADAYTQPATYDLFVSKVTPGDSPVYSGTDTCFEMEFFDTGEYHWRLEANTTDGVSATISDSFSILRQKTICFAGHSIIVGMGGETQEGGFRREILDTLRSHSPDTAISAVGPVSTPFMQQMSLDDSCFLFNQKTAYEIDTLLRKNPSLSADIWVLMIGVNADYYSRRLFEHLYTQQLLDRMYERNNQAHIYVLNGIQLPDSIYENGRLVDAEIITARRNRLYDFNHLLEDFVTQRREAGHQIFLVDAFSALSPDSLFNAEYMHDHLHPNQQGYGVLAKKILKCMSDNGVYSP